jgi:hypothetical protein
MSAGDRDQPRDGEPTHGGARWLDGAGIVHQAASCIAI